MMPLITWEMSLCFGGYYYFFFTTYCGFVIIVIFNFINYFTFNYNILISEGSEMTCTKNCHIHI